MRIYRDDKKTELEKVICNRCKKELKVENGILREGCFEGNQRFGYFSSRDGERYRFELCEACFDELLAQLLLPPEITEETELL